MSKGTKYVVIVPDGMADEPIKAFRGKTPMEAARTPAMDEMARLGEVGLASTVPKGMVPGSDVANLAILGLDPTRHPLNRGAIEAAAIGLPARPDTLYFRANLITVKNGKIFDYSAGHIDTRVAMKLLTVLNRELLTKKVIPTGAARLYPGVSYRHTLAWRAPAPVRGMLLSRQLPGPHDLVGQEVEKCLAPVNSLPYAEVIRRSADVLDGHPLNHGKSSPANMIWLWAQGDGKRLPTIRSRFGLSGTVISGVDLVRGLGKLVGLNVAKLRGATGYFDTDFSEKARACLTSLKTKDFVYLHIEAPDEAGHEKNPVMKKKMIETIDAKIVAPILAAVRKSGWHVRVLVMPDHPTPCATGTHSGDPVPFLIWDSLEAKSGPATFSERSVQAFRKVSRVQAHTILRDRLILQPITF